MALWKITVRSTVSSSALKVTKGMNVEISTSANNPPLSSLEGKKAIVNAFKRKYDVDLQSHIHSGTNLIVEKIG